MKIPDPIKFRPALAAELYRDDYIFYDEKFDLKRKGKGIACYASLLDGLHYGALGKYCLWSKYSSKLTEDMFLQFMYKAKRAGFIPNYITFEYEAKKLKGRIAQRSTGEFCRHDVYITLCFFRWCDSNPILIRRIMQTLDEVKGTTFIQAFLYNIIQDPPRSGHSFIYGPKQYGNYSVDMSSYFSLVFYLGKDLKGRINFARGQRLNSGLYKHLPYKYLIPSKYPDEIVLTKTFGRLLSPKNITMEKIENLVDKGFLEKIRKSDYNYSTYY